LLGHTDTNRVFEMVGVDEDWGDLRTRVKGKDYAIRVTEYTFQSGQDQGGIFRKVIRGAMLVAKFHSPRNDSSDQYHTALNAAERMHDDIIEKMIRDSRNGHPLFGGALDRVQDFQSAPAPKPLDGSYAGWEVVFTLRPLFPEACDSVAWTDGGTTPIALVDSNNAALIDDEGSFLG
jgi:hypothetical protein